MQIKIISREHKSDELKKFLEEQLNDSNIKLELKKPEEVGETQRTIDPTILVAIVGGTFAILTTLIAALSQKSAQTIIIQKADSSKIEVPANTPLDKIDEYLKRLDGQPIQKIVVK